MKCIYHSLPDGRLKCSTCGDATSRIWSHLPQSSWPQRQCGLTATVPHLVLGCGDYLAQLLATMPVVKTADCGCDGMQNKMNEWGATGCRENRSEIVDHLVTQSKATSTELPFGLDLRELLGELVDEAIRRAELSALSAAE